MDLNQADWQAWYDRHGPALLLYARQLTRSLAEAEDALHDGFVRFWKRREQVDDTLAYVYRAVRSAALDRHRSASRRVRREQSLAHTDRAVIEQPWQSAAKNESEQQLRSAVGSLPEPQREVLVMKIWGGLTYDQIACAIDAPRSTAAARYQAGIRSLREAIADKECMR